MKIVRARRLECGAVLSLIVNESRRLRARRVTRNVTPRAVTCHRQVALTAGNPIIDESPTISSCRSSSHTGTFPTNNKCYAIPSLVATSGVSGSRSHTTEIKPELECTPLLQNEERGH